MTISSRSGEKMFRQGKLESNTSEVDAIFFMMRTRESALEQTMKALLPGVYTVPRSEGGQPDHAHRIVWLPDKTPRDLRTIAATMKGSLGIAKSRAGCGIRVRCADYVNAKKTLQPEWSPQESAPYDRLMTKKYELHHVHEAAGRNEILALLNTLTWKESASHQTATPGTVGCGSRRRPGVRYRSGRMTCQVRSMGTKN